MNVIGEDPNFYGCIIGLQLDRAPTLKLFAKFDFNGKISAWIVPDWQLFKILSLHLCDMSEQRNAINGTCELWIEKTAGKWQVTLP